MINNWKAVELMPRQLVNDFLTYAGFITAKQLELTKTKQWLSRKDLMELNTRMSEPEIDRSPSSDQDTYPLLHLFYHLGLAAGLFNKIQIKNGKSSLTVTDRLPLFNEMNKIEQYVCLLEAFWVDANWKKLQYAQNRGPDEGIKMLFEFLLKFPQESVIEIGGDSGDKNLMYFLSEWNYFLRYFAYFGLWEFTKDEERMKLYSTKYYTAAKTITPTPLLHLLGAVFIETRNLEEWNLPLRREDGDWRGQLDEAFIETFKPLFPKGELVRSLPRLTGGFFDGTYELKVVLHNCWRNIRISSHHTLHQLHHAIQDAFDFGNDHLYAFFMDGQSWSKESFYSPDDREKPSAEDAKLGKLSLRTGQSFLYLFDYGDEWHFQVTVEKLFNMNTKDSRPQLLSSKGKAPEQYGW